MKTLNYLKTVSTFLVVLFIASSCSTVKQTALDCPELPGSNANIKAASTLKKHNKTLAYSNKGNLKRHKVMNRNSLIKKKSELANSVPAEINSQKNNIPASPIAEISVSDKIEYNNTLIASVDNSVVPITSVDSKLTSPFGESAEIGVKEVNVTRTNVLKSPVNPISKSNIAFNKNSNKLIKSYAASYKADLQQQTTTRKIEPLGLAGFISSLVGLLVFPFIFGTVAIVFGAISLGKILKYPDRFRGLGFAIASLVIGVVDIIWVLIVVAGIVY
ncbi:MAG: DUF4190 domain-containing protein [Bacteroidota bacterium]